MVLLVYFSDNTVRQIVILSLTLAAGVSVAAMIMMICRKIKSKFGSIYVYTYYRSGCVSVKKKPIKRLEVFTCYKSGCVSG